MLQASGKADLENLCQLGYSPRFKSFSPIDKLIDSPHPHPKCFLNLFFTFTLHSLSAKLSSSELPPVREHFFSKCGPELCGPGLREGTDKPAAPPALSVS